MPVNIATDIWTGDTINAQSLPSAEAKSKDSVTKSDKSLSANIKS